MSARADFRVQFKHRINDKFDIFHVCQSPNQIKRVVAFPSGLMNHSWSKTHARHKSASSSLPTSLKFKLNILIIK